MSARTYNLQAVIVDGCGPCDPSVRDDRFTLLEFHKGRDTCIRVCVVDRLGAPFDLTGGTASLCLKKPVANCPTSLTAAGVLSTDPTNCLDFNVTAAQLKPLVAGVYLYEAIFTPTGPATPFTILGVAESRLFSTIC